MLSSVTKIVWIQIEHIELKSTLNRIFDIWYPAGLLCYLWVIADVKAPLGEKQTALEFKCVKINACNFCLRYCFGQNNIWSTDLWFSISVKFIATFFVWSTYSSRRCSEPVLLRKQTGSVAACRLFSEQCLGQSFYKIPNKNKLFYVSSEHQLSKI